MTGLFPKLTRAEYDAVKAFNQSKLKVALSGMDKFYDAWVNGMRKESEALTDGQIFDCLVTEPHKFPQRYVVVEKAARNTREGKANWEWAQEQGKQAVAQNKYDQFLGMRSAMYAHPWVRDNFRPDGENQAAVVWEDQATGLPLKGLMDIYRKGSYIADVKTTRLADATDFEHDVLKWGYDIQAAFYQDGVAVTTGEVLPFVFIVVSKAPSYNDSGEPEYSVAVAELSEECLEAGREQYQHILRCIKECKAKSVWPPPDPAPRIVRRKRAVRQIMRITE
jgi:hypothetical protein